MKKLRILLFVLVAILGLNCIAFATFETEAEMEDYLSSEEWGDIMNTLPDAAKKELKGQGIDNIAEISGFSAGALWDSIKNTVKNGLRQPLRVLCALIGATLLCATLKAITNSFSGSTQEIFRIIISVFIATILLQPINQCVSQINTEIVAFSDFLTLYIPVFSGVITAAGQPLTAAAYNILLFGGCQAVGQVLEYCFLPLISCFLCLSIVSAVCPDMGLRGIISGSKRLLTWALGLTMTLFLGLLTVQSVVASGGDSVAAKTAKFFISSAIPVVGGTLSDLFMATQGCMQLIKGTAGAFGIVAAVLTFLPPLLRVLIWDFILRAAGVAADCLGIKEVSELLRSISTVLGMLVAILVCYAVLFTVSTALVLLVFKGG